MRVIEKKIQAAKFEKAYTMVDGALTLVKWNCIKVILPRLDVRHEVTLPDGRVETLLCGAKFYKQEKDFLTEQPIPVEEYICTGRLLERIGVRYDFKKNDDGEFYIPYVWIFRNGQPVKLDVAIGDIRIVTPYLATADILDTSYQKIAGEFFTSYEDCVAWNDYEVVDEDGARKTRRSRIRALQLTEEQKALVQELCEKVSSLKEQGVRFMWDSDECVLVPINVNGCMVEEAEVYNGTNEYQLKRDMLMRLGNYVEINDFWINYDYGLSVKFKDEK